MQNKTVRLFVYLFVSILVFFVLFWGVVILFCILLVLLLVCVCVGGGGGSLDVGFCVYFCLNLLIDGWCRNTHYLSQVRSRPRFSPYFPLIQLGSRS